MRSNRAKHIRFFRLIYGSRQRSYNLAGIKVSICYSSAVSAFKTLAGSFSNVIASVTRLTCISRWHSNTLHTIKQSLIFNILPKHRKIPLTKFCPKLFISSLKSKPDISKVFNCDPLTLTFSGLNNRFCDSVINYGRVILFFARKPFQKFFSSFCAFALNRTTNLLPMFTVFVKPISRMLKPKSQPINSSTSSKSSSGTSTVWKR